CHLHGVAGRGAGESQALRSRQAAAGRGPRQRRPQADRLYPAIPSASLSPVATVLRRRSGGTTIGAPTWKTASPSCSTTWALMAAGNSFSPPRPPFAPSYSCSTDWPSSSARLVADLPRAGHHSDVDPHLRCCSRPSGPPFGAPPVGQLGRAEGEQLRVGAGGYGLIPDSRQATCQPCAKEVDQRSTSEFRLRP